ncbi:hypothetical protein M514_27958 [Trichuris suis]|uniref:Reverse transcriptase domain-containing protein n=1 Tax=Trichuris suis TaxID=68888 RepID=A0A085MRL8_9BILA|nr:hypothetical protein M514_27958 [Trichuris suis]
MQIAGPAIQINTEKVELALPKMKNDKATGADDLPNEFWELHGPAGVTWLTALLNQIIAHEQIP